MGPPKGTRAKRKKARGKRASEVARVGAARGSPSTAPTEDDRRENNDEDRDPETEMKIWRPGVDQLQDGEELVHDPSTYEYLHAFTLKWPCLSFDFLSDELGDRRSTFPENVTLVAGSQADTSTNNEIVLLKVANIPRTKRKRSTESDDDDEEDNSDSGEDDEENSILLAHWSMKYLASINRIRSMPQHPGMAALWSEQGIVEIFDMRPSLDALHRISQDKNRGVVNCNISEEEITPQFTFRGHSVEGFALGWSPVVTGRLASGDCHRNIHVWEPRPEGRWLVEGSYGGHIDSVEDIQWSPTESDVFASCSVDKTIKIWDTRVRKQAALTVEAHSTDVNVISWSRLATCILASGSDDGELRIWDLRNFKSDSQIANFDYHRKSVTSIEWSPFESSVLAASADDDLVSFWDLSLERDVEAEEEARQRGTPIS